MKHSDDDVALRLAASENPAAWDMRYRELDACGKHGRAVSPASGSGGAVAYSRRRSRRLSFGLMSISLRHAHVLRFVAAPAALNPPEVQNLD